MKKLTTITFLLALTISAFSQNRAMLSEELRDISCKSEAAILETMNHSMEHAIPKGNKEIDDWTIGMTYYDLQTNASMQPRVYLYPDGYIGGTFTFGENYTSFPDRGTGFNSTDGANWGNYPTERIESDRTGWPSYTPWGANGEMIVSHYSGASIEGLAINKRVNKGSGNWQEMDFLPPAGASGLVWPRTSTSGIDHTDIHLIALTTPIGNGGVTYQGLNGALLYSRSSDGGNSWDIENVVPNGLTSASYAGFSGDIYEVISEGDNVAILIGDDWSDLVLLKSGDNGATWSKTVIWEHPYPFFDHANPIVTDTFYSPDGAHGIAYDVSGKIHLTFGLTRGYCDGETEYYFPLVGGLAYWNEDMPVFSNNFNALNPYGHPDSELIEDYNLIAWLQDVNGNGTIDLTDEWSVYYLGAVSMPQLVIDELDNLYVVFSALTETYDNGYQNYRHLWARAFDDAEQSWGDFDHLTDDLIYIFSECVFPSCSPVTDNSIHLVYQEDGEPGLAVRGDLDPYYENQIRKITIPKADLINLPDIGDLEGHVTKLDGGSPLSGAIVSIEGTSFVTISSYNGYYSFEHIPIGEYTVNCTKSTYVDTMAVVTILDGEITVQDFQMVHISLPPIEVEVGETKYDLQSNYSMPNCIYRHPDGFIGATFTYGMNDPSFPERGTGYNIFNGSAWGAMPTSRIELIRTGWPTYAPWGSNGEIVVAHSGGDQGLVISSRPNKGTGDWNYEYLSGPVSTDGTLWPRCATSNNNDYLHIIASIFPESTYQGMERALLYSRSPDGGQTWDMEAVLLDEINSDYYLGIGVDSYDIATYGDNVAFLFGDRLTDLVLMKSTDNGDTWEKTIVWEHPYPFLNPENTVTDTFYCPDGSHSLTFDVEGDIHVAFSITKAIAQYGLDWDPMVDGIVYWNETRPTFSNNLNALNPYGHPDSELIPDYSLIGWSQDINGNGQLDILEEFGYYNLGISSMSQLVVDETDNIFLVYSSVTEGYDNGDQNYRHLWARGSNNGGENWGGFVDLTNGLGFAFSECIFPSCSPTSSNDKIYLIFHEDDEPGLAVMGDEDPYNTNRVLYMEIGKTDIIEFLIVGNLSGTVTDIATNNPIEGAKTRLDGTSFFTNSLSDGSYNIDNIQIGDYTAICSKMGYYYDTAYVIIEEGMMATADFQLEEAVGLEPPENLSFTIYEYYNLLLQWEAPATGNPVGYNIYRDNEWIANTTNLWINDEGLATGLYGYFVTALYETGESLPSDAIEVEITAPLNPPTSLYGYIDDNDVTLIWTAPGGGSGNGEWIQWDSGENIGNGIGITNGTFYVASRWMPVDLADFDGMSVSQMSFFPYDCDEAIFVLKIWTGTNATNEVMSQNVESFISDEFNIISLDNPVTIDASMEYWFGYEVYNPYGCYPAGVDGGPAIQEMGDMVSLDAISWVGMSAAYGLDYNWNLAVYVDDLKNGSPPKPISKSVSPASSGSFVTSGKNGEKQTFNPPSAKDLTGYNVYRNGEVIGTTNETTYTDYNLEPSTYEYCITAVYDEGESVCSNSFAVVGPLPLYPPTNFSGPEEAIIGEQFCFTWDDPDDGDWIHWDTGENTGNGIGLVDDGTFFTASHWMPSDIEDYDGHLLTKISFFPVNDPNATYTLKIWTGENESTEIIMSQDIQTFLLGSWNEVVLNNPIVIDGNTEYWFGYAVTHLAGTMPAGLDDGPAIAGFGDMFSIDGIEWFMLSDGYNADYNWNIQIYLNSNKEVFAPKSCKDLLFYNLYRNGELLGDTDCDIVYSSGLYTYCVTAVYDEGESVCSNEWVVDVITGIDENELSNIQIFPNPASDVVNIKSDTKISNVKVYGFAGQIIMDKKVDGNFYQINTSQFKSGICFFRIETEEGVVSERIVVR
ncbi:MAG: hypothetical protein DRJ05_03600 [Bacteroidetes bacterium]|nr:MAG: hypothetical protein DRJ05_03600 [Bacteroidota bacterium]